MSQLTKTISCCWSKSILC